MTRAEREAEARRLRDQGLLMREIAERMGVAVSTVDAWLNDPGGIRLRGRKRTYAGTCERCGSPTDGSNGPRRPARLCAACFYWPDDRIIQAIHDWADSHGGTPPTGTDWLRGTVDHPSATVVVGRLGWNQALLRAGYELHMDRRPETQAWIEREVIDGVPVAEIARQLGVTPQAIHLRFRARGTTVRKFRDGAAA